MAANNPTVVVSKIDGEQLKASINQLVSDVDTAFSKMASSVDSSIGKISESLSKLEKSVKNSGLGKGTVDEINRISEAYDKMSISLMKARQRMSEGTVRQTAEQAVIEFNKKYKESIDKAITEQERLNRIIAQGKESAQQSMRPRERWDVRQDSEINQLRMTIHGLESDLRKLDSASLAQAQKQFSELDAIIKQAKMDIEQLKSTPITDPNQRTAAIQQIHALEAEIRNLQAEQAKIDPLSFNSSHRTELLQQIEAAKARVRELGQEFINATTEEQRLIESGQKVVTVYEKITSRGDARKAFEQTFLMDGSNLEGAIAKMERIKAIMKEVYGTPFVSDKMYKDMQSALQKAEGAVRRLKEAQDEAATGPKQNFTHRTTEQIIADSERQRQAIIQTGLTAQQEAQKITESMKAIINVGETPATGVKELVQAIKEMRSAYWSMSASEKESPIGRALKQDIELAQKAAAEVQKYNSKLVFGGINEGQGKGLDELRNRLSDLNKEYALLPKSEAMAAKGTALIDKFHRTQREIDELQKRLSRPTSFAAAKALDESTLDNIIEKIAKLNAYKGGINLNDKNQAAEMKKVDEEVNRLNGELNKYMSTARNAANANNTLTRSWNYMKNRLAFYFTVGASTQFIKNLIEVRGQYEMNERALGILIDSAERGTKIFHQLSQMALISPYTLIELSNAAKQLSAYGVEAGDLYDTTRRLADVAAAVGAPIERISYALGHIQSYGYLTSLQARQFANMGIPLVKALAERYSELEGRIVSVADVYDRMKKKQVSYNDVMSVVNKMTDKGGRFFDFQAKVADTLKVQVANLTLAWNNMLNAIGSDTQGAISALIKGLKEALLHWVQIKDAIASAAMAFGLLKAAQFLYFAWFRKAADRVGAKFAAQYVMGQKMTDMFTGLGKSLQSLFLNPWTWVFVGIAAITDMVVSLKSANEAVVKFNQELAKVGKERFDKIGEFLNTFTKTSSEDASKSWEAIKEEIEQSSSASASFIAQLEKIEDISQRIDVAEKMLKDIQQVQGVVSKFGDNSVKINQTLWHGLFGEGLMDDFDDFVKSGDDVIKTFGDLAEAEKYYNESVPKLTQYDVRREMFSDYINDAQEFRKELDATYESLKRIATDKNFNALQQRELMETIAGQETQDKSQEQQLKFRIELEKKFTENYKKEIDAQIAYSESVGNTARANELKARRANWLAQFGEGRALTEGFFSYLQATAKTETEDMFKGMSAEEIAHIDKSKPEWEAWAKEIAQQFSKEYGLSFKDLWALVKDANTWSIQIPVFFKTIGLPLNDVLKDYQTRTGKAAQGDIANAKSQAEIIELLQKKQAALVKTIETAKKAGGEYYDKNKQQWNEENKDLTDQIHAYGALTKAEEQAAKSANKRHTGRTGKKDKPEDKVAKALKDELSVIKEMQSNYDKLRKAGFSANKALTIASYGYEQTLRRINAILTKYGVSEFKASDFVGKDATDPNTLLKALKKQRATLLKSGKVKMESIKDLDIEIQRLSVSAKEYNMQKITEGLNNQLNKIKDEYELAVELDANPELGQILTDALGIDTSKFPKTVEEAIYKMQSAADAALDNAVAKDTSILDEGKVLKYFDILEGDIQKWADEMGLETTSTLVQSLQDYQKQARDLWKKDAAETIAQWEKLLEKYGEYVAKRKQILLDYENDLKTARRNNAPQSVYDAIETRNAQQLAGLDFDMLQQSQTWITATGDLSKLADSAIQILINDLVKFKKANKNLDPKNMQKINKTLRQLYKQQKSENPFLALTRVFDAAKERFDEYQEEIDQTRAAIKKYEDMVKDGEILNDNQIADLTRLKDTFRRLKREQQEVAKVSVTEVVGAINSIGQAANGVANDLAAMFDALSGTGATEAKKTISDITGILEKGGQGAALGVQIGGGWGALIGGVAAGLAATVTTFFDKWSGNADITKQIEDSQWEVKKLEQAYQKLEYAIEDAYGTAKYGAMQAAVANKKLQLVELQHQLDLEKSRKKKNQDKETILELENSIISLEREIQTGLRDITNDMLGISSIGDAAESMVAAMIDAFKAGEDYMGKYSESFDEMIDNMIVKAIVGKVIGDKMQQVFDFVDSLAQGRGGIYNDQITDLQAQLNENRRQQSIYEQEKLNSLTSAEKEWYDKQISLLKQQEQMLLNNISMAEEEYAKAVVPTPEDVNQIRNMTAGWSDEVKSLFDAYMAAFGITFGQGADKNLSALQQGIQGITEDTAGALEAYMNSVSQQVYYQSAVLTEIRDAVVMMDGDIQMTTQAEMLLQLQQSYAVQVAIQSLLMGWSNANGMAMRVELIN